MHTLLAALVLAAGTVLQPASTPPASRGSALTDPPKELAKDEVLGFTDASLLPDWATKPADRNAAVAYLTAHNSLPKGFIDTLMAVEWDKAPKKPGEASDDSFDAAVKALREGGQPSLDLCLSAAALVKCDFELSYEAGVGMLMPHLSMTRALARTLRLDARAHLLDHRPDLAAKRLAAMFAMSAHVANDRVLISTLVSVAIASLAAEEATVLLDAGTLAPADAANLRAAIAAVTSSGFRAKDALTTERDLFLAWFKLAMNKGDDAAHDLTAMLVNVEDRDLARRVRALQGEALDRELARAREAYDEVLAAWGTPPSPDTPAKLAVLEQRLHKGDFGMIARISMPSFNKAWTSLDKVSQSLTTLDQRLAEIK
jgi:hypothetical protein